MKKNVLLSFIIRILTSIVIMLFAYKFGDILKNIIIKKQREKAIKEMKNGY